MYDLCRVCAGFFDDGQSSIREIFLNWYEKLGPYYYFIINDAEFSRS